MKTPGEKPQTWVYLFLATGSVLLLTILAFTSVSLFALRDTAYRQTEHNLKEFGHSVIHLLETQNAVNDRALQKSLCLGLATGKNFRITLIASDGTVIADSSVEASSLENHAERPEVMKALGGQEGTSRRHSKTLSTPLIYYAIPWRSMVVRLAITVENVDSASKRMALMLIVAAASILALSLLVSFLVSLRITIPLRQLEKTAEAFAEGRLDLKLRTDGYPSEFANLARALTIMADRLRDKIDALDGKNGETNAILSGMHEALIMLDGSMRIVRLNPAAESLFGLAADAAVGLPLIQAVRNTEIVDFAHKLHEEGEDLTVELRTPQRTGSRFLRLTVSPVGEADGRLLVFSDVTRLKTLERVRKDFVANVSHELKTPVTSIKGFIETLKDGAIDKPETARRFLGIMDQQAARLGAIIDDLLTVSRLEHSEGGAIAREPVNLSDLFDSVKNLCSEEARRNRIELDFDCPEDLTFSLNPGLIEQALTNLILNGVKYSLEGQRVGTKAEIDAGSQKLILTVTDTGIGIPEKHVPRLFERFYRVDPGRSRDRGGTGLGLSIVRHIVLAHGGTVSVKSVEGEGSVFRIEIPRAPD